VTLDEKYIIKCFDLAIDAGKKGDVPVGSVLVHDDEIIMTAQNTVKSDDDSTRHAEMNLLVKSERAFSPETVQQSTVYTSTEPCVMCTAAIWKAGIRKIVYSVSLESLARVIRPGYKYIPCEEVFERLETEVEVVGSILEEEGLEVWRSSP